MELIELKCPNCGAQLENEPNQLVVVCNYCKSQFIKNYKDNDTLIECEHLSL